MRKILLATGNAHKVIEVRQILGEDYEVVSLKDAGIDVEIDENGQTFSNNALIKARAVKEYFDGIVVADDSGLSIDALGGDPGVKSARFLGEDTSYDIKNAKILDMLKDVPDEERGAAFICAVACILEDGSEHIMEGAICGRIGSKIAGENGFGYDPIFYVPEYGCTTAQMSSEQKNEISHRGRAFTALKNFLEKNNG